MTAYSVNARAEQIMGRRVPEGETVMPFDYPCELGYWCPVCRQEWDEELDWSEYRAFLWCGRCNVDYPSALCVPLTESPEGTPDWRRTGIDRAVEVYLDSVGHDSTADGGS